MQQSNRVIQLGGLRGGVTIREYTYNNNGIGISNGRKSNNNKGNVMAVVDCNFTGISFASIACDIVSHYEYIDKCIALFCH